MPDAKADPLVKAVEALLAEKESVAAREAELISALNAVLGRMGYRVVRREEGGRATPGRRHRRRRRGPGRPPGVRGRRGPGRPPKP